MSQSQFSFQSSTHGPLQQAMGLLQQKDLIIQKYMQKLGTQEGKIEELVQQIQRLNWENRQKQYHEEYIRKIPLKHLLEEGFAEEIYLKQNEPLLNGTSKKTSQRNQNISTIPSNKLYLVKIVVNSDAQEIQLTDKMQLFKDNLKEITYQKNDMKRQKKQADQIESYCQSVLREVQSLRAKMELEKQEREIEVNNVKDQNTQLKQNITKLQGVIKESKQTYAKQLLGKQQQIQSTKKSHQAQVQSIQSFLTGQIKQLVLIVGTLKQQLNDYHRKQCQNKLNDKVIDEKVIGVKVIEEQHAEKLIQQQQEQNQQQRKQQQQMQQQVNSYKQEIKKLRGQVTCMEQNLQKQRTQHQTITNSKNQQLQSLRYQISKLNEEKPPYNGSSSLQIQVSNKESKQQQQQVNKLQQQLQELTLKYTSQLNKTLQQSTLIQTLQTKLTQMTTNFYQVQQQPNQTVQTAKFRNEMSSQTDPELVFDINFLRKTKQTIVQTHRDYMQNHHQQNHSISNEAESFQYKISLPPSLDILNFDFDNSMSEQPHNVSNAEIKKQIASNLSSGSFGCGEKHMEEMKVTHLNKNAKKYLSEQVITFDTNVNDNNNNNKGKGQLPMTKDDLGPMLKEPKLKTKVASYSQRNIIVEQPYQDQDNNDFRINYVNIIPQMSPYKGREVEHSDDLIPSLSDITDSNASYEINIEDPLEEFVDIIRDDGLGDSDHPSQTYKNSLILPYGYSSGGNLDKSQHKNLEKHALSKSIGYNVYSPRGLKQNSLANKATQLLELKSPQYIMKTLIQKSFPIETNPFKLSNEYFNVAQLMKQENKGKMDYLSIQKNKSSNHGSDSVINIMIESHQRINEKHDHVQFSISDPHMNSVTKPEQISNPGTIKEKESEEKMENHKKEKLQTDNADFRTPRKKETIELAQSIDFDSLKKIERENAQNTKSRKKPKIIYFRR